MTDRRSYERVASGAMVLAALARIGRENRACILRMMSWSRCRDCRRARWRSAAKPAKAARTYAPRTDSGPAGACGFSGQHG